jgi:hypothetical protein
MSNYQSDPTTPPQRQSLGAYSEHSSKEKSLWRLNEKFVRITEELDTARDSIRETGKETFRDFRSPSICQTSVEAKTLEDEPEFKGYPILKWCPYCAKETATEMVYKNTTKTFLSSLGIFLSGGFLGCFLLPYVSKSCKQIALVCSSCKHELFSL